MVLQEPPVLGGNEGFLHDVRNLRERYPDTAIARLEHVGEGATLAVEHHAHGRQLAALEAGRVGQVRRRAVEELDHLAEIDHRIGNVLVLAELVVGGVQIGEVDAVESLDVAGDRFGVVQGGGDQIIEVDRIDVERLPHMGAAVAQDLHDFDPILDRIEMRLDRLRRSCDFA